MWRKLKPHKIKTTFTEGGGRSLFERRVFILFWATLTQTFQVLIISSIILTLDIQISKSLYFKLTLPRVMESWHVLISVQWPGAEAEGDGSQQRKEGTGVAWPGLYFIQIRVPRLARITTCDTTHTCSALWGTLNLSWTEIKLCKSACRMSLLDTATWVFGNLFHHSEELFPLTCFQAGRRLSGKMRAMTCTAGNCFGICAKLFLFYCEVWGSNNYPCWDTGSHCPNCRRLMPWH